MKMIETSDINKYTDIATSVCNSPDMLQANETNPNFRTENITEVVVAEIQ
jgi:hypothetical protein